MKTIGVVSIDPWFVLDDTDSLFKDLIYFDELIYRFDSRDTLRELCYSIPTYADRFEKKMRNIEDLERVGLIRKYDEALIDYDKQLLKNERIMDYSRKGLELLLGFTTRDKDFSKMLKDFLETFREVGQVKSRIGAILLNSAKSDNYIPIIRNNFCDPTASDEPCSVSTVLSVALAKFPIVPDKIELNRFMEFKSDSDTQLKVKRLRDWVLDISKKNYETKEIEQKIDYLLHEYYKQFEIHELKYELGKIEVLVTTSLEVIENMVKLNFTKAAKVVFELGKQDVNLLEAEQRMMGREVAIFKKAEELNG